MEPFNMDLSGYSVSAFIARRRISRRAWAMFSFALLAFLVTVVTFVAPGWAKTWELRGQVGFFEGEVNGFYGMWFSCWTLINPVDPEHWHMSCELMLDLPRLPDWYHACQVCSVLALVGGFVTLTLIGTYLFNRELNQNRTLARIIIGSCLITGLFEIALFTVFCVLFLIKAYWCCGSGHWQIVEYNLHYCFFMSCTTPIWYIIVSSLAGMEISDMNKTLRQDKYMMRVASTRRDYHTPYY